MPPDTLQRRLSQWMRTLGAPASEPLLVPPEPFVPVPVEQHEAEREPVAADSAAKPQLSIELIERRRFIRPIPIAQATECSEAESWEIWSQWSSL
jgi:hypothetical protein